jgi:hypothetical protein
MAYYTALINAWNAAPSPPSGVTGTGLTGSMTTDQKLVAFSGWTVVGPAVPMIIPTYQIYNVMVRAEFDALTAPFQQSMRDILNMGTVDGSSGTQIRARIIQIFPSGTVTFTNLSNLAKQYDSPQIPWWQGNGYPAPINGQDLVNAGLS